MQESESDCRSAYFLTKLTMESWSERPIVESMELVFQETWVYSKSSTTGSASMVSMVRFS